jgi:hypothetical protein
LIVLASIVLFLALGFRLTNTQGGVFGKEITLTEERSASPGSTPVLIELFTSEGCSSCPPADALLARLARTQPVSGANAIVLEEHVDYWDRLGWKDPFSSAAATARQDEYAQARGGNQVYTPQMIVDGHAEFVGNSDGEALRAIRAAAEVPKPAIHLSWAEGGTLAISIDPLSNAQQGEVPQIYLAVTESMLHSDVKRGENAGRALVHDGVVRQLTMMGNADPTSMKFSSTVAIHAAPEWNRANLRAVVFAQERRSRRVLAASAIPFPM